MNRCIAYDHFRFCRHSFYSLFLGWCSTQCWHSLNIESLPDTGILIRYQAGRLLQRARVTGQSLSSFLLLLPWDHEHTCSCAMSSSKTSLPQNPTDPSFLSVLCLPTHPLFPLWHATIMLVSNEINILGALVLWTELLLKRSQLSRDIS